MFKHDGIVNLGLSYVGRHILRRLRDGIVPSNFARFRVPDWAFEVVRGLARRVGQGARKSHAGRAGQHAEPHGRKRIGGGMKDLQ